MRGILVLCVLAVATAGCATSPTTQQAKRFATAAREVTTKIESAFALDAELVAAANAERSACVFMRSGQTALPALPHRVRSDVFRDQLMFATALVEYSDVLADVTDGSEFAELQKAADGLAGASARLVGTIQPSSLPVVQPAFRIVSLLGVNLYEYEARRRIRVIVEEMAPILREARRRFINEIELTRLLLDDNYRAWLSAKRCTLASMRNRGSTGGGELYDHYVAAEASARGFRARSAILANFATTVTKLVSAHNDLLNGEADVEKALAVVERLAIDLRALLDAAEE